MKERKIPCTNLERSLDHPAFFSYIYDCLESNKKVCIHCWKPKGKKEQQEDRRSNKLPIHIRKFPIENTITDLRL